MNKPKVALLIAANLCAATVITYSAIIIAKSKTNSINPDDNIDTYQLHVENQEILKKSPRDLIRSDEDTILNDLDVPSGKRDEYKKYWANQFFNFKEKNTDINFSITNNRGTPLKYINNKKYLFHFSSFANEETGELFLRMRYISVEHKSLSEKDREEKKLYKTKIFKLSGFKKITKEQIKNDFEDRLIQNWKFNQTTNLHDLFVPSFSTKPEDENKLYKNYNELIEAYNKEKDNKLKNFIKKYFSFDEYEKQYYKLSSRFKIDENSITFEKKKDSENTFIFKYKLKYNSNTAFLDNTESLDGLKKVNDKFYSFDKVLETKVKLNFLELRKITKNIEITPSSKDIKFNELNEKDLSFGEINSNKELHKFQKTSNKIFKQLILGYKKDPNDPEGKKYLPFEGFPELKPEDFELEYDQYTPYDSSQQGINGSDFDEGEITFRYKLKIKPERKDLIEKYGSSEINGFYKISGFKSKDSNELLKEQLNKIRANVENKKEIKANEVQLNKIIFDNYKDNKYEIIELKFKKTPAAGDEKIIISFKLKRTFDGSTSEEKTYEIDGFKK
ncbi:MAG: MAG1430 family protein [Metamycoplasmataceae bacterium]